jgi:predicted transcriptional regulator of viral defense system
LELDSGATESAVSEQIIGMDDMMAVYEVTDLFGIDRETISVPLEREGRGRVSRVADGGVEITVPAETPTRDWLPTLTEELRALGFEPADEEEDEWS